MKVFLYLFCLMLGAASACGRAQASTAELTPQEAVALAIASDPWLTASQHTQAALADEATAAATLPDPRMSLTAGNFPVDSFDIRQEPMTQLAVGLSQVFPRGDTLALAARRKLQLSRQQPLLRDNRRAKVAATVAQLWLDAYTAQESIRLIEADRALFDNLLDAARAGYATAVAGVRQQDVIRAQLELTRLEDRLTTLRQQQETAQTRLAEWIGSRGGSRLAAELPVDAPASPVGIQASGQERYQRISHHPALLALDKQIAATATGVDLARQKFKPEWGLNAQYGYRDSDLAGRDRADLFSVGLSVDLPIFTADRQDREVSAAIGHAEAIRTERQLLVRRLTAELETASRVLSRLDQRQALYAEQLLPQMAELAESSLAAYNNDVGDFAEAVRARIGELNARLEALVIAVQRQKTIAQINYLLARPSSDAVQPAEDF